MNKSITNGMQAAREKEINKSSFKYGFEIRQIDAWMDPDGAWTWNESYCIALFSTRANDEKRAFLNALHHNGIVCKRGKCVVVYDGDIYELRDRKTGEPLFAAIPLF